MADDVNLLTLMHISDLHFSDRAPGAGTDPGVPALLAKLPFLDGLLGHHGAAVSALDSFYHGLGQGVLVLVTGDITANGAPAQRSLADHFISGPRRINNPALNSPGWKDFTIPGNHDQWPGTGRIIGGPSPGFSRFFPNSFPAICNPISLANGVSLRFILVDTDADVNKWLRNRVLARGDFVSQLTRLQTLLNPPADSEIRVLLLHHSLFPEDPKVPRSNPRQFSQLEIELGSQQALETFLVDSGIKVTLCGHRHTPRLSRLNASNGVEVSEVMEARCGTTTQRDRYPADVVARINPNKRRLPPNSLILHKLVERQDGIYWQAQIFWRSALNRFVDHNNFVTPLLPKQLSDEIKVLPA